MPVPLPHWRDADIEAHCDALWLAFREELNVLIDSHNPYLQVKNIVPRLRAHLRTSGYDDTLTEYDLESAQDLLRGLARDDCGIRLTDGFWFRGYRRMPKDIAAKRWRAHHHATRPQRHMPARRPVIARPPRPLSRKRRGVLVSRFHILQRDGFRCQLCGVSVKDGAHVRLEVDHRIPRTRGGTNALSNLWTLCFACNRGKGTQLLS